jgi:hypothetical protein
MPVLFDSASSSGGHISNGATSGTTSSTHNVSPAATHLVALACVLWTGGVDTTSATFGVTFGGTAMTALGASAKRWSSNQHYFQWFILDGSLAGGATVPTGSRTVTASFSSMPTESNGRAFMMVCATYSNVASVGTPVAVTPTTTTSNSVTVPSVLAAHRVVTTHAAGNGVSFTPGSYNKTIRGQVAIPGALFDVSFFPTGGTLIIGDAPGAASVTATATQNSSALWAAAGVSLAPTTVVGGSALTTGIVPAAGGGTYRTATPVSDRYWTIPGIGEDDPNQIAGNFVLSSDGVHMPVWVKDPNDVEDYAIDWSNIIAEDDHIISAKFTPTSSALQVFSTNIGDSALSARVNVVTSCWFIGGVASVNYGVVCHVTTTEGRQHDRTFRIVGGQK